MPEPPAGPWWCTPRAAREASLLMASLGLSSIGMWVLVMNCHSVSRIAAWAMV